MHEPFAAASDAVALGGLVLWPGQTVCGLTSGGAFLHLRLHGFFAPDQ